MASSISLTLSSDIPFSCSRSFNSSMDTYNFPPVLESEISDTTFELLPPTHTPHSPCLVEISLASNGLKLLTVNEDLNAIFLYLLSSWLISEFQAPKVVFISMFFFEKSVSTDTPPCSFDSDSVTSLEVDVPFKFIFFENLSIGAPWP